MKRSESCKTECELANFVGQPCQDECEKLTLIEYLETPTTINESEKQ